MFRPYYEKLSNYNCKVKAHKMKIAELESQVLDAKATYNDALQNLERISDEIHQERANSKINNQEVKFKFNSKICLIMCRIA